MNILYMQHVDTLPDFFPQFLDIISKEGVGLGKKTENGWIITTDSIINGVGEEAELFNKFTELCRYNGYSSFYTTKKPA
jgi:hypothetical protein